MAEDDVGMAVITPDRVALDRAVPDDAAAAPVVDLATLTFRIGRLAMVYNHRDVRWNDHYSLYGGGREQNASEEEKTLFRERQRELSDEIERLQEQRTALLKDSVYLQAFDINPEKAWIALSEEDRRSKKFVLKALQTVQDIDKCPELSDTLRDYRQIAWDRDVLLARLDRDDFAQHWDPPFGTIDDAELVLAMVRILPTTLHAASNELWTRPQFVDDVIRTLFDNHDEHCAWKEIMRSRVPEAIAPMAIMSNPPSRFVFQSLEPAFYRVARPPSAFPRHSRVSRSEFFAAYVDCVGEAIPRPFPLFPEMASRDNHATMVELILGHDVRFLRYASERLVLSAEFMDEAITPAFQRQADESWESLTEEQQGQRPFVLAALRNYQRFTVLPNQLEWHRFDNVFPELSADQEVFLARSQLPGFDRAFGIPLRPIPAAFANNDAVMLAVASRHPPYIEHTSGDLLSSEDFVAQAIPIAGYALMASEPARRTLRQFPHLFVQLLTLNVRTEYFTNLTEHASEMASFQWSRELAMVWLTRVGPFPKPPDEHSSTFYPMVVNWYSDTSFMISAISATDRLKTLYVYSEDWRKKIWHMIDEWGHGWTFDLMLAAVVSSRDVVAVLESTFESEFFRLYIFAQLVRMKLANRINFRSWVESSFGRSISSLGEEAIKNEIADFVGVPKAEMVPQLEEALNVLQQLGH